MSNENQTSLKIVVADNQPVTKPKRIRNRKKTVSKPAEQKNLGVYILDQMQDMNNYVLDKIDATMSHQTDSIIEALDISKDRTKLHTETAVKYFESYIDLVNAHRRFWFF